MEVYTQLGQQAIFGLLSHIFFIGVTFYALQCLRLDQLFKKGMTFQVQLVYILLAIAIGSGVSNFFISFTTWSMQLHYLI
jgi:uncharacterized integral membrane protein (TIGR02327 family)